MSCKCFSGLYFFFFYFILLLLLCIFTFYILGFISILICIFEFIIVMLFLTLSYKNFSCCFVKCTFYICVNFCLDWWPFGKESTCQCRTQKWVQSLSWKGPLEKEIQPIPVFLPGKSHWQKSLMGYSPRGHKSWTWLSDYTTTTKFFDLYRIYFCIMLEVVTLFFTRWLANCHRNILKWFIFFSPLFWNDMLVLH